MTDPVHAWLAAYAAHLRDGVDQLATCGTPDSDWVAGCQKFDDRVRQLGGDALRAAVVRGPGPQLLKDLQDARAAFDAASLLHVQTLNDQLTSLSRGRKGLRGYDDVGRRMTSGSALYLERRY